MKYLFTILIGAFLCHFARAQKNSYMFEETTGTYTDLQNPTVIQNPDFGSGDLAAIDLTGETFWFYGVPYNFGGTTTFQFQTNGNIRIDNDTIGVLVDAAFVFLDSLNSTS